MTLQMPQILIIDDEKSIRNTLHDILEAIVGALPSFHMNGDAEAVQREDGSWLVDGKVLADELKELLDRDELPFEDENLYQTLGGLVMAFLDRIPRSGDHFDWNGFRFEVVDMDGHRVDKVMIKPLDPEPPALPEE